MFYKIGSRCNFKLEFGQEVSVNTLITVWCFYGRTRDVEVLELLDCSYAQIICLTNP
jgi:hypothetical protein